VHGYCLRALEICFCIITIFGDASSALIVFGIELRVIVVPVEVTVQINKIEDTLSC
jgi:hypothetical protein